MTESRAQHDRLLAWVDEHEPVDPNLASNIKGVFADLDDGGLDDEEALRMIREIVGVEERVTEREPMGAYVALSAAQLEHAGVPPDMTSDELGDLIDKALLADDTALQQEVQQWIEDREAEG